MDRTFLDPRSVFVMKIKILRESKNTNSTRKNSSRGVAFVEFSEHQHALVALRVLNNNPGNLFHKTLHLLSKW